MTTKTFEEFMSKIDSMKIEEALKNSEKLIEALEACGIRCVKAEGYISQPIITGQYPRKNYRITTKESDTVSVASGDNLLKEMKGKIEWLIN